MLDFTLLLNVCTYVLQKAYTDTYVYTLNIIFISFSNFSIRSMSFKTICLVNMSVGPRPLHAPFQLDRAATGAITKCPAVL